MPHKIYVGNYPNSFIEDDVLNLFQDFEGVELVGFFKNRNKCYSFLHCLDMRQLIEIVANLHDIDVCGRNLIVRAADQDLQKRIQKSMLENGTGKFHPKNTCDTESSSFGYENNGSYASTEREFSKQSSGSKNAYGNRYQTGDIACHAAVPNTYNNARRITKQNAGLSDNYEYPDYSSHYSDSNYSSRANNYSKQPCASAGKEEETSFYQQNISESERENSAVAINPQKTFAKISKPKTDSSAHYKSMSERFESYKPKSMYDSESVSGTDHQATNNRDQFNPRRRNTSESSLETVHDIPNTDQCEKLSFVSVMNFPLYLNVRDLYELFADFQPLKVFMMCNEPRKDKTPTEAVICFENDKDATEAILTLDNTVYQGRIILVTDAVDRSIVSELLSFGRKE